jgi:hypothetical protein
MVAKIFQEQDRACAEAFYEPWYRDKYLPVVLGEGDEINELSGETEDEKRGSFFRHIAFAFYWPPTEGKNYWMLGYGWEYEDGGVYLEKEALFGEPGGAIFFDFESPPNLSTRLKIANDFPSFIRALKAAGWAPPQSCGSQQN